SQNATNAGLWHFTSRFDQLKETNSIVDIGYHLPAYVTAYQGGTDQGLVGHWALDGTAVDSSGYGHDGTMQNGATWTSGQVGSGALGLDGVNDYLSIGDNTDLRPAHVTVCAWFNATNL